MAGLVPAIFLWPRKDARDEPGHDEAVGRPWRERWCILGHDGL